MGKSYDIDEIRKILDDEIHEVMDDMINDTEATPEEQLALISYIRSCRKFSDEVLQTIAAIDEALDARMAKWKAEQAEKKLAEAVNDGGGE